MNKIKNIILGCAALGCIALAGVGVSSMQSEVKTATAETTTNYTVVDTAMFVKFSNEYVPNGNFNVGIVLPEYDFTGAPNGYFSFGEKDLASMLDELGFFDNIMIAEKTLREWGCTSLYSNTVGFGEGEPQNQIVFRCHADPEIWNTAVENGEVVIPTYANGVMSDGSKVTVKEGALIPGFMYFSGIENATVYRASMTYIGAPSQYSYSWYTVGQTDIESLQYTTDWDENYNNAYLGVSLVGDDYLGDGEQEAVNEDYKHPFSGNSNIFVNSILVNGEKEKLSFYSLYNLGEKGKGYLSFVIEVPQEECVSITIPKGTLFPARAVNDLRKVNAAFAYIMYETQTDKTFYMMDGVFVTYADYKLAELESYKAEEGYFRAEEEAQRLAIVEEATSAIKALTEESDIDEVLVKALSDIDALKTAAQYADEELAEVKASANAEIKNYLSDVVYLDEQQAQKVAAVEAGLGAVVAAKSEEEITQAVVDAKAAMDEIATRATILDAAKAELDAYKADVEYREQEASVRAENIATAKAKIDSATSQAAVEEAVAEAKAAIDELKSAAELVNDALENSRKEANTAVNTEKAKVNYDLYTTENQMKINELYKAAKDTLVTANSKEEMDVAVETFKTELAKLPKEAPQEEEKPATSCMASLSGMSAVLGLMTMLGFAVISRKKEK